MRHLLTAAVALVAAAVLGACSLTPKNQPCYVHSGVQSSRLSNDGHTLVVVCRDGAVLVRHP